MLRIGHDRFLPGLRALTETVREASGGYTRLFIQVIDFLSIRRRRVRDRYLKEFLKITPRHRERLGKTPNKPKAEVRAALVDLTDEELIEVLDQREWEALQYGAQRARHGHPSAEHPRPSAETAGSVCGRRGTRPEGGNRRGGVHYAHAYTMASFLSAINTREDGYGGSLEGRVRPAGRGV